MTERNGNQEKKFSLPPSWCGSLCRNAMNEVCIESCAVKRDCSAFEAKPDLKLTDIPRFPLEESANMTREEKFTSVTVYLAKVVDHLQGRENEQVPIRRPRSNRTASSKVSPDQQSESISSGAAKEITVYQDREER